jgi:hypothetical protein
MSTRISLILRLCITLATVLFLAFVARNTLTFPVDQSSRERSTFVIHVSGNEDIGSDTASQELWVRALLVDGQLLRWNSVRRTSNWHVPDRMGLPPFLLYRQDSKPALLTFQGRNFLAILQPQKWSGSIWVEWSGSIRVEQDGKEVQVIDLKALRGRENLIVAENPVSRPSTAIFVGALVLFGSLACWFGPIRSRRGSTPWLVLFLSFLHILFWASQCVGTTNDSPAYLETFSLLLRGQPSFFPPGYPALLGLVGSISSEGVGRWVTLIQHGMVILAGVWIYFLLRRIIPEELALVGGLLAGALPPVLTMPQTVMSEIPTLFAMVGAMYFSVRCAETGRLAFSIVAGLLTGWAGTMRGVPLAALLPSIIIVHMLAKAKRKFLLLGVTIAVTAGVVLIPILWVWQNSGRPVLADSLGSHLFNRVVTEQRQLDEDGPATKRLLTLLEGKDPRGIPCWEILGHRRVSELSRLEGETLLRKVSLEGIRKDPLGYLSYSPRLAWNVLVADPYWWILAWGDTIAPYPRLETPPPVAITASSLTWRWTLEEIHRVLWPILCWAAVAGIFLGLLSPQRILILALAWVPTGYLLSSAFVEYFNPRYNVAIVPFVAALSMVPFGLILTRFTSREQANGKAE